MTTGRDLTACWKRPEFSREQIFKVRNRKCKEKIDAMGSWKDE